MAEEVDLVNDFESVLGHEWSGATRATSHACVVTQNIESSSGVEPALRERFDAGNVGHVDFPPFYLGDVAVGFCDLEALFDYSFWTGFVAGFGKISRCKDEVGSPFRE